MSIIATIAALAVPLGAWAVSANLEKTAPLDGAATGVGPGPQPEPVACLNPVYYSPTLLPASAAVQQMGAPAQAILDGVSFYFTPAGQDALLASILQRMSVTTQRPYRGNRSVIAREALASLFPDCNWDRPLEQYTPDQYSAWLSAWPLAAAAEADNGLSLDVGPQPGQAFIAREAVGLSPSGGTIAMFPNGTLVRFLAAEEGGDNGTFVDATVLNSGPMNPEVAVETSGPIAQSLGLTAGTKHVLPSLPGYAMTVVQSVQGNPRVGNPQTPPTYGPPLRQPAFSPRTGR